MVSLVDPTHRLADLLGPYLEMFWASTAFETTLSRCLIDGEKATTYTQGLNGSYERSDGVLVPADVLVEMDIMNPPAAELAADPELPTIIVRTAPIGVAVSRPPAGGSTRIPAKAGGDNRNSADNSSSGHLCQSRVRPGQAEAVAESSLVATAVFSCLLVLAEPHLPVGRALSARTDAIVDPIVSLIEDQIAGLQAHGIDRAIETRERQHGGADQALLREVAEGDAYFCLSRRAASVGISYCTSPARRQRR